MREFAHVRHVMIVRRCGQALRADVWIYTGWVSAVKPSTSSVLDD